jgi:phospholipid/cholesterol/gamma-HCH transport system permease protein
MDRGPGLAVSPPGNGDDARGSPASVSPARFTWKSEQDGETCRIALGGDIHLDDSATLWKCITEKSSELKEADSVELSLTAVSKIDGACVALLVHFRSQLIARGVRCEFVGGQENIQRVARLYGSDRKPKHRRRKLRRRNAIEHVGDATVALIDEAKNLLSFGGALCLSALGAVRRPRSINFRDTFLTMERVGADATPIVVLINFLIGFVVAYQSADQLQRFGADIYVVDLIGVSMTRELAPLMTAIIVCGRSGAAFAAELGTMKVSQEIDALRTLGFTPLRYLVIPKLVGTVLVVPLLVILGDVVGIFGAVVVAGARLDITPTMFVVQLRTAVTASDIISGLVKAGVFSAAIAIIACQQGLATSGGAQGVGRRTTSAVVATLFALIILDAIFTVALQALGL